VHAMEGLTLARERSPIQDALLRQALALHKEHFSKWLQNPDPACGLAMATAACLGGLGIHNARTGLIHSLAVPFAARFHLPHQTSLLPFILPALRFNRTSVEAVVQGSFDHYLDWVSTVILSRSQEFDRDWSKELRAGDLEEMARECARDHVLFKENPQPLSEASLLALYTQSLG